MRRPSAVRGLSALPRGAALAIVATVLLCLSHAAALAIEVPPTVNPLPGSQFQGGDGDQSNVPGLIDWQGLEADGRVNHVNDPSTRDDIFTGGDKEDSPNTWGLTTQMGGANPSSANILDSYRALDRGPNGDLFLYLAFTREASEGTVFATFELNQDPGLWNNGQDATIPCRTTGDILISFEPHGSTQTVGVERWVTDLPASNGCAKSGHLVDASNLVANVDVQGSFNSAGSITNYMPGFYGGSVPRLNFGEAAVNLSRVVAGNFHTNCAVFASTWMHSRSSDSESSDMKDYVAPVAFDARTCKAKPALATSTSGAFKRRGRRRVSQLELGAPLRDTARLTGGDRPTGAITFRLHGPDDARCSSPPVFTWSAMADGNGDYQSGSSTPTAAGVYRWVVDYSGDQDNEPAGPTSCGASSETAVVSKAQPSLTTSASGSVNKRLRGRHRLRRRARLALQALSDTATLAGGESPTGTIAFRLYGPDDADCSGTPAFTSTAKVDGNGPYTSGQFIPADAGVYRWIASYPGDANNAAPDNTSCHDDRETVVVSPAHPNLVTFASPSVAVGSSDVFDRALLTGASAPTGKIAFRLYGPDDANCSRPSVFSSNVAVASDGLVESEPFTPTKAGTYRWVASYAGDRNNQKATTSCGDNGEEVVVAAAPRVQPTLNTTASAGAGAGSPITDTAHLAGGAGPTGEIQFLLYGPSDDTCTGTPGFAGTKTVTGNGDYTSPSLRPAQGGSYHWVASYGGDDHNLPAASACNDSSEAVVISKAGTRLATLASGAITVGGDLRDVANLSGGSRPTGRITFNLYGPNDATCSGPIVFSAERTVTRNGPYRSPSFSTTAAGVYRWVANFSGDANNAAAASACNASGETALVRRAQPRLSTKVRSTPRRIRDAARVTRGVAPTGQVTFQLYGPDDANCSRPPVFTTATVVNGAGSYNSQAFTPTASGPYTWVARYSGDANNRPAGPTTCGEKAETVNFTEPATPGLTSTASAAVEVGGAIHDTAHLSGGFDPRGTITFRAYGPADDSCSGTAAFSSTVPVAGNDDYDSAAFTPSAAGVYRWRVTYSGDRSNHRTGPTSCLDSAEATVVRPPAIVPVPTVLTSSASPAKGIGAPISDVAHLSGGVDPSGAITFELFGPDDTTCSRPPVLAGTVGVTGNGDYASEAFVPALPGSYRWVVSYGGDANNAASGPTACGDPAETVSVDPTPAAGPSPGPNAKPASATRPRRAHRRGAKRQPAPRFTG